MEWNSSSFHRNHVVAMTGTCGLRLYSAAAAVLVYILYNRKQKASPGVYAGGGAELDGVVDGESAAGSGAGIFFHGRLRSSRVIPSNFVSPTTGGSPLWTNSYCPGK
jgi:hypothetical protein